MSIYRVSPLFIYRPVKKSSVLTEQRLIQMFLLLFFSWQYSVFILFICIPALTEIMRSRKARLALLERASHGEHKPTEDRWDKFMLISNGILLFAFFTTFSRIII